jgi:hypothetical protein
MGVARISGKVRNLHKILEGKPLGPELRHRQKRYEDMQGATEL